MVLARRLGLSKADYQLGSLHPNARKPSTKQPERASDLDSEGEIFAPPMTESDEESEDEMERQSASMSSLTKRKSSNASIGSPKAIGRRLNVRSLSHQSNSPTGELSNPASIIPPSSWHNYTVKRSSHMMSGDISEEDGFSTAKRKPKRFYTNNRQSTTLDTSPKTGKMNKGKTKANRSSPAGKKSAPEFRTVDTRAMILKGKL